MQEQLLKQLIERMDILISLNVPPHREGASPVKGVAEEILKLCNAENTANDMVKKTGKKRNQVDVTLSKLRSQGLIKSIMKDNNVYYVRLS